MKIILIVAAMLSQSFGESIKSKYVETSLKIISKSLTDSTAYNRLGYMCDTFGPRLSGSKNLENAINWILKEMKSDGLENIRGEKVAVPTWIRGKESVTLLSPFKKELSMLGLGGSIATPRGGLKAEVIVVNDWDELESRSNEVPGKIVLFNAPFTSYGETVAYRYSGASAAAKHGAVASLIRSIGPWSMNTPHTGVMAYDDDVQKNPHAALTMEDAMMLSRIHDRGDKIIVKLDMNARMVADRWSQNVLGEIRGSVYPDEVVVVGGHIDSWDVGQGAQDDGGGCVASWEAVRLIKELGLKPKRTIRCVLWTNEEIRKRIGYLTVNAVFSAVTQQIVAVGDHVPHIDPDAQDQAPILGHILIAISDLALDFHGTAQRIDGAGELDQKTITGSVGDAPMMLRQTGLDHLLAMLA